MHKYSHVSRTDLNVDGKAIKFYKRSYPFSNKNENRLFFKSFTCDPMRINLQLESTLGNYAENKHDKMMEFSTPITGSYNF